MSIFGRIAGFVRDVRITAEFPSFEAERRREHVAEGEARFSSIDLQRRIKALDSEIADESMRLFDDRVAVLTEEVENITSAMTERNGQIELLQRNFDGEFEELDMDINALYEESDYMRSQIDPLKEQLANTYEERKKAYARLDAAKREIDKWHRRAKDRPRNLPQHSLFGQSMGDLHSLKNEREQASRDIGKAKADIASLKSNIGEIYDGLDAIRSQVDQLKRRVDDVRRDRSSAGRLYASGVTIELLENEIEALAALRLRRRETLAEIQLQREEYTVRARLERKVEECEAQVENLARQHEVWIQAFDLEEKRQERKDEHRAVWLRKRGLL